MSAGYSPEFSRKLPARGWVGMAVPREYSGRGRSAVERYLVIEELLAAGAPVAAPGPRPRRVGRSQRGAHGG